MFTCRGVVWSSVGWTYMESGEHQLITRVWGRRFGRCWNPFSVWVVWLVSFYAFGKQLASPASNIMTPYPPAFPAEKKLTWFLSVSGTTSVKSGVHMSTPGHPVATPLLTFLELSLAFCDLNHKGGALVINKLSGVSRSTWRWLSRVYNVRQTGITMLF